MKTLFLLFVLIVIFFISTLFIPFILNLYQLISVSILITYISWQTFNVFKTYLLSNNSLKPMGRSVLITGCDSGFGYSTALRLHDKGWHVLAAVLTQESKGSQELQSLGIKTIELNVVNESHISRAYDIVVKECQSRDSKLWAVVNNAGVYTCGELEWGKVQDFETLFQINVFGYIRVLRQFLPLIRRSRGRIINMSSVAALFSAPGTVIYSASKATVSSLTEGLRRELYNTGVEVIEVLPQAYKNTLTAGVVKGLDECWKQTDPKVKQEFGENYYKKFRSYIERNINSSRDKPSEVVDSVVNSVTLQTVVYKCVVCGPIDRLIVWSFNWMPTEWLEPIVSLFTVGDKPLWTQIH